MCHDQSSRPPAPPTRVDVVYDDPVVLDSLDGTRFLGHLARPDQPNGTAVVIMPDVRGLQPFYRDLAGRFAETGAEALAIDYYGRTAGMAVRGEDFDYQSHVATLQPEQVAADVASAVTRLGEGQEVEAVFTVGFCFGGGMSWRMAAQGIGIAGAVGFYGRPASVQDVVEDIAVPLLLLVAGADAATPLEVFTDLDRSLAQAGVRHEMHVYDGAPHSFFDRDSAQWEEASEDAWRRVLDFMARHAPAPAGRVHGGATAVAG